MMLLEMMLLAARVVCLVAVAIVMASLIERARGRSCPRTAIGATIVAVTAAALSLVLALEYRWG